MTRDEIKSLAEKGADFSKIPLKGLSVSWIDFSSAKKLTPENLFSAKDVSGCKLPSMDFLKFSLAGKNVSGIDFREAKNLTAENLFSAKDVRICKLPHMDFLNFSLKSKDVSEIDFSRAKNLTLNNLISAKNFEYCAISEDMQIKPLRSNAAKAKLETNIYVIDSTGEMKEMSIAEFAASKKDPAAMRHLLLKKFGE
ncbi:MAG: hypothetical protein IKO42_01795 [Opitutales bacterium]|nr:hypothetical protein [Opitutales bacterium]